jgi:2OG-Fe(II) oxygenase superfamily
MLARKSFSFSLFLLQIALAKGFKVNFPTLQCRDVVLWHRPSKKHASSAVGGAAASQRMLTLQYSSSFTLESSSTSSTATTTRHVSSSRSSTFEPDTKTSSPSAYYLQPPPYLADLDIGASIDIDNDNHEDDEDEDDADDEQDKDHDEEPRRNSTTITITKLANDPPLFWVQNFLSRGDCETLIRGAAQSLVLQNAETRQGVVEHRVGSKVAWMGDHDNDNDDDEDINDDETHDEDSLAVSFIAGYTQHLSANLFLPHAVPHGVQAERLQVVQYDQNGKFDIHHDGFNRTVTVLTYLNGVAGTWFPYIEGGGGGGGGGAETLDDADMPLQQHVNNQVDLLSRKQPGHDGLCMVSSSSSSSNDNNNNDVDSTDSPVGGTRRTNGHQNNHHVVQVQPGDAIVFYNYQDHPEHGRIMSWKSLHCGLPATREKWIATNWLRANDDDNDHDDDDDETAY